jgi:acetolactate synthase I/II/III large subunit
LAQAWGKPQQIIIMIMLTRDRFVVQIDFDESVFNRKYEVDIPVLGDINPTLEQLIQELKS